MDPSSIEQNIRCDANGSYGDLVIAIDIDNTITATKQSKRFFRALTNEMIDKAKIILISNRNPDAASVRKTASEMKKLGIVYHDIVHTANKAEVIEFQRVNVFFEDTDEYFLDVPKNVLVLKPRENGNFDFNAKKWIYGDKTGRKV